MDVGKGVGWGVGSAEGLLVPMAVGVRVGT